MTLSKYYSVSAPAAKKRTWPFPVSLNPHNNLSIPFKQTRILCASQLQDKDWSWQEFRVRIELLTLWVFIYWFSMIFFCFSKVWWSKWTLLHLKTCVISSGYYARNGAYCWFLKHNYILLYVGSKSIYMVYLLYMYWCMSILLFLGWKFW